VSTHARLQEVSPPVQPPAWHLSAWQDWVPVQAFPHFPQCSGLDRSMQMPLHTSPPPGQPHLPAEQTSSIGHCVPHAPQWLVSVCKSKQPPGPPKLPPHCVRSASQVQALLAQTPRGVVQFVLDRHATQKPPGPQ
jgi:hypothetical protein